MKEFLKTFDPGDGSQAGLYSLPALEESGVGKLSRLPVSLRIVLESLLRNCDEQRVSRSDVETLAQWKASEPAKAEIPFVVARIVLQDFTGVPLLVDLAAMRDCVEKLGKDPELIEPLVPVDLVVDHSVQVDFAGSPQALHLNLDMEFRRNRERYEFLKWGQQAFDTFRVIPPGIGIVHQVNLEYLAKGVLSRENEDGLPVYYPDTLVGTDSHTTMINGLGIVGWGVGGIEAEAGMLGQPVAFLTPEVVGVHMTGALGEGVTATDLALHVTQMLRATKVVGKFVEFHGEGAASLPVADRATIANMAPEYGATMGFFPVDDETIRYMAATGRTEAQCQRFENYFKAQNLFGMPRGGEIEYSTVVELDLGDVKPSVAGPKRPQDRIAVPELGERFRALLEMPVAEGGYGLSGEKLKEQVGVDLNPLAAGVRDESMEASTDDPSSRPLGDSVSEQEMITNRPTPDTLTEEPVNPFREGATELRHGKVLIAAITSCTNTSNPSVMLAAGLVAKKAVEKGLTIDSAVKTSLAPGSRVVTDYLAKTGLQPYLDQLGFNLVGYGCTTCIGNSGPLHPALEEAIQNHDLVVASVLSGNRNFEARVHQSIKANFLMSPPLVVAFALAGRVDLDLTNDPIGSDADGNTVYLQDLWPSLQEIREAMESALQPEVFQKLYSDFAEQNPKWNEIPSTAGRVFEWKEESTYIQKPPFFDQFSTEDGKISGIKGARPLGIFGDSVTTDHISPAGAIKKSSPAGKHLLEKGVDEHDFNSYGSRRGNDRIMTRGTFANVRIKNLMVPDTEGGVTRHYPSEDELSIYDCSMRYQEEGVPLMVLAGHEYGTGSSRDWAAKGTRLLGVRAVVAASFERIHRSNLVGMGVLPLQFEEGTTVQSLNIDGSETFDVEGLSDDLTPGGTLDLIIHRKDGSEEKVPVHLRIDTPVEVEYYRCGGILPYVLKQLLSKS